MLTRYGDLVDAYRAALLRAALLGSQGNRTHAARALGLQRTYLLRLMRVHGVSVPRERVGRLGTS
jgi:DNA-binding NtrC family response regulator